MGTPKARLGAEAHLGINRKKSKMKSSVQSIVFLQAVFHFGLSAMRCFFHCRSLAGYDSTYDCTEIYRRSHAGYACSYDCTDIYREEDEDDDEDEDGAKNCFKLDKI